MMDFGIKLGPADGNGDGHARDVLVLLHHPECASLDNTLPAKQACAAAAAMFQAVSMHPVEHVATYLAGIGNSSHVKGSDSGRWMRRLLLGVPHSSYGSIRYCWLDATVR